jgi:hypothetical protein
MKKKLFYCVVLFMTVGLLEYVSAQSSANFKLVQTSMSSAGGAPTSANYKMKESAMGAMTVGALSSASFRLNGGVLLTPVDDPSVNGDHVPTHFQVLQNYPNPFNPTTNIQYDLPQPAVVKIRIYNELGQVVKTYNPGRRMAGSYQLIWNGCNDQGVGMPNGIYYYQVIADGFNETRIMTLVK